jgi:WD40 repeat protein
MLLRVPLFAGMIVLLTSGVWGEPPVGQPQGNPLPAGAIVRMSVTSSPVEAVTAVTFSPDGKTVISKSADWTICQWEARTGKLLRQVKEDRWSRVLAISPDGKTVASAGLWNINQGGKLAQGQKLPDGVRCLAFSPDSRTLALACDDRTIRVWDVKTEKEIQQWTIYPDWAYSLAFSPDGQALAVGGCQTLRLIQAATGKELRQFQGHQDWVYSVAFAPDGQTLVSAGTDRTIRLWEVADGKEKGQFSGQEARIYSLALAPDGRTLASAGSDQTVRLWEIVSCQEIRQFTGHQDEVCSVRFSPDGRTMASGSEDQTILVWDLAGPDRKARPEDLDKLWADLSGDDAGKAHRAIWTMIAMPKDSVTFLRGQLKPVPPIDAKLLADLDSNAFAARQKATEELERIGEHAAPALRKILADKPSLEVARRIEEILGRIKKPESSQAWRQFQRSLQVIEQANDAEARKLAESLASGMPESPWTQQAKASLERMTRRLGRKP